MFDIRGLEIRKRFDDAYISFPRSTEYAIVGIILQGNLRTACLVADVIALLAVSLSASCGLRSISGSNWYSLSWDTAKAKGRGC